MRIHFLCLLLLLVATEGREASLENICQEASVFMYCSCDGELRDEARTVNCFIFNSTGLNTDSHLWEAFEAQQRITTLAFTSSNKEIMDYVPLNIIKRHLNHLETYKQTETSLRVLPFFSVVGLQQLGKLELDRNSIQTIEERAIYNLPKLAVLSLAENELTAVKPHYFAGLSTLKELYLDRNNISRIEDNAFRDLESLTTLSLWSNDIASISQLSLSGLKKLETLDLFRNKLRRIPYDLFHETPNLKEISLKENLIEIIGPDAFDRLPHLQSVTLNKNKLKVLRAPLLMDTRSLRLVDFSQNKLERMSSKVIFELEQAKDQFFAVKLQENPWVCDCEILWMADLARIAKNKLLRKELNHTFCTVRDDSKFQLNLSDKVKVIYFAKQPSVMAACKASEPKGPREFETIPPHLKPKPTTAKKLDENRLPVGWPYEVSTGTVPAKEPHLTKAPHETSLPERLPTQTTKVDSGSSTTVKSEKPADNVQVEVVASTSVPTKTMVEPKTSMGGGSQALLSSFFTLLVCLIAGLQHMQCRGSV